MSSKRPTSSPSGGRLTLDAYRKIARAIVIDTGAHLELDPWELWIAADLLAGVRETHIRVPEENGKTTWIAADNLIHLITHPKPRAVVAARNEKQAKILYMQAVAMVSETPELDRRLMIREGTNEIRKRGRRGDVGLSVIPADELSAHGGINTRVTLDEMHALPGLGLYRVLAGKLGKREGAQFVGISTAGEPDSEYEQMWAAMLGHPSAEKRAERVTRVAGANFVAWCWALEKGDDTDDMDVVKLANPSPRITSATLRLKRDLPGFELKHWLTVVCNMPTRDFVLRFLGETDWDAAIIDGYREIPAGAPIIVGADWGWTDDATAFVPAWYDGAMLLLGPANIVDPPRNGSDLTPQEALLRLAELDVRNPIEVIAHDESMGGKVMTGLLRERFPDAEIVPVSKADADQAPKHFNEQLRAGLLKHTGDPTLKRHLMNATRVPVKNDPENFRIDRPKASRHAPDQRATREIDGAVAAVNAVWGAVGREPGPRDDQFFKLI